MDRNIPEEQQEQKDQGDNTIDRVNDVIDRGRSAYNNAKRAKSLFNKARAAKSGASGAKTAATTTRTTFTVVRSGVALFGSGAGEAIAVLLLILAVIAVVVVVIMIILMLLAGNTPPKCSGIDSDSDKASSLNPAVITVSGCPDGVIYSWKEPSPLIGSVTPTSGSASVLYYPTNVTTDTEVQIAVDVCWASSTTSCTSYSLTITATPSDCSSQGGNCIQSTICNLANDLQPVPGICSTTGTTCCKPIPTDVFKFYCQYGSVNTNGRLTSYGSWNYLQSSGRTCEINTAGCAPTSFAMVLNSLGYSTTPKVVSQKNPRLVISNENIGCRDSGVRPGTSWEDIFNSGGVRSWIRGLGFNMTGDLTGPDMSLATLRSLKSYIDNGCYIVAGAWVRYAVGAGLKSDYGGHAFAITDVDVNNRSVTAYDPTFCRSPYIGGKRTFTNVTSISTSAPSSVNGWIFATAICR